LRLIAVDTYDGILCLGKKFRVVKGPYERSTED
jgi:hypothetical protein